jgi:glycosyltransferase involved in cell wall biosynthesis
VRNNREVVHVVARYPPALGGMEQVAQDLARAEHQLGMQVQVLTSDEESEPVPAGDSEFPVSRLRSFNVAHTPVIPGLLPALLRLRRRPMIHLHISSAFVPEVVWVYARLRRIQYVAHVHLDVLPSGKAGILLKPYKRLVLRRVLHDAAAIIVPTDDYREIICRQYRVASDRITVIPNGTTHKISDRHKSMSGYRSEKRLLFVGRLSPQKNIPLLLESAEAYLARYGNDIMLTLVGDGPERVAVKSRIQQLGLNDVVTLPGAVTGSALESIYASSDLLMLTSVNESFGIVLIEAMTKGLPIISVNIPAVRNIVDHQVNGLLVEPDPAALADAVYKLLADDVLYPVISKNNLAASHLYNWKSIAQEFITVYDSAQAED